MKKATAAIVSLAVVLGSGLTAASAASPERVAPERRNGRQVVRAGKAGAVVLGVRNGRMRIIAAKPRPGWRVVDARRTGPREVDVLFRSAKRVVEVETVLDGGRLKTEVSRRKPPRAGQLSPDAMTLQAGPAGTVTVQLVDGKLTIVGIEPAAGFTVVEQRSRGLEVDVTFLSDGLEVEFEIDVEDGRLVSDLEIESRRGANPAVDGDSTFEVGGAGSLVLNVADGDLSLVSTAPATGWTASRDREDDDDEVEVHFSTDTELMVFSAELDDNWIEVEIEFESTHDDSDDDEDDDDEDEDDDDDEDDEDDEDDR
jgi:hypothetical protein